MDWMSEAAVEAAIHLEGRLRPGFGPKSWAEFSSRLSEHGEPIFRLLHRLYGWRYDFAWLYEQFIDLGAEGFRQRPRFLRAIDRRSTTPPSWLADPASLMAMADLDRYAGTVKGLRDRFDHLATLGVTHLHLISPDPAPGAADPGSPAGSPHPWRSHRLGTTKQLRKIAAELREIDVTLVLDMRVGPTTVAYQDPELLKAVAGEMVYLANLGAGVIRVDGAGWLWKEGEPGSANPEAHLLFEVLAALTSMAAPSTILLSGAMVPSETAAEFVRPDEFRLAYNSSLMSSVWEALATSDTRLLSVALGDRFRPPAGCTWITYLRSNDDLGWWFADPDAVARGIDPDAHRRYLSTFYTGQWAGSSARGQVARTLPDGIATVSGTAASLAGLESAVEALDAQASDIAVRRVLAAWAVIIGAGGVPMVFLGDEIAQLSAHAYTADPTLDPDPRWSQRPFFEPARFQSAADGQGPEGAVLAGFRRLLEIRRAINGFGPEVRPTPVDLGDPSLIAFQRGPVLVVVNMTDHPLILTRTGLPDGELHDLVAGEPWAGHLLGPYEYRYVERRPPHAA